MPAKEINLLPQEDFEKKPLGKFLLWALNVGRWIVIAVELVVVLAFFARFKLDRDLADLYEKVREKQAIVVSSAAFEKDFLLFQKRLVASDKLIKNQLQAIEIISAVAASTPQEIILTNLEYAEKKLSLSGLTLSEKAVRSLTLGLDNSPLFEEISLENISRKEKSTEGTKFNVTATFKKK